MIDLSVHGVRNEPTEPQVPQTRVPGSFRVATQLMQEALPADAVSVGPGEYNQEALFANPYKDAREEALVINSEGKLTYLERTDASDTGWRQVPVTDMGVLKFNEVVIAVHPGGDVYAFCSTSDQTSISLYGSVYLFQLQVTSTRPDGTAECTWRSMQLIKNNWLMGPADRRQGPRALSVSYTPDAGPVVCGSAVINGQIYFSAVAAMIPPASSGGITGALWVQVGEPASMPSSAQGRLAGGGYVPASQYDGGAPRAMQYVFYLLDGGTLRRVTWSPGSASQSTVVSSQVKQFCGTWNVPNLPQSAPQGDIGFSYLDSGNDDVVFGYGYGYGYPYERRLKTLGLESATIWQDADGKIHVFGEDADGTLRVLHQDDWRSIDWNQRTSMLMPGWTSAMAEHPLPNGIGGYDLANSSDRMFSFDYDSSGKADHFVLYRPYDPDYAFWVVKRNTDPVETDPDNPPPPFEEVFYYNITKPRDIFPCPLGGGDIIFAYDYEGTGCLDHVVVYRTGPGGGVHILKRDGDRFVAVYQNTNGIFAGTNFTVANNSVTRLFAFDYAGTGHADHLVIYTPGGREAGIIGRTPPGSQYPFTEIYASRTNGAGDGIGGYDMANSRDLMFAFDYNGSGRADHLVAYRPGVGTVFLLEKDAPENKNPNLYRALPKEGNGIGGYPMTDPADRLMAYSYGDPDVVTNKPDHLVAYRPQQSTTPLPGIIWILQKQPQNDPSKPVVYNSVFESGDPVSGSGVDGIGGFPLNDSRDQITVYDYDGSGRQDHLVLYRPGGGIVTILESPGGDIFTPVYRAPSVPTLVSVGLMAGISAYQVDPYPDYKPSQLIKLSGATTAEQYCISTQDVTTSVWSTDKVRLPADTVSDPHLVSRYVANATLIDTTGGAMSGHTVSIASDALVEVTVGRVSYQVGPGRSIAVTTDATGRLSVSVDARGLTVPTVYLNADGLAAGAAIDFACSVNDYLAGTGSLPSQQGQFDADALKNAECTDTNGKKTPLVRDWDESPAQPDVVVTHCSQVYGMANGTAPQLTAMIEGYADPQPIAGYVIQNWDPSRPTYQVFRTVQEIEDYRAYRAAHPAYGGWWESFTSWASDVWEGVKSGASKVAEVIVNAVDAVVEIAVWIGNAIVSLGKMIIEAIEQAVQAVEAVFQMIADAVMRVIDWLKSLFAFRDIWDTKTALQKFVNNSLDYYVEAMDHYGIVADTWFQEKVDEVHDIFRDLKKTYATARAGDLGNLTPPLKNSAGSAVSQGEMKDNPQGAWLMNQVTGESQSNPAALLNLVPDGDPVSDALDKFIKTLQTSGAADDIEQAFSDIYDLVTGLFDFDDSDTTGRASLYLLFDALENFIVGVLKAVDAIVQAFITFFESLGANMKLLLNTPITDMPIVSGIYRWVQTSIDPAKEPESMTVLGLACLVAGFFATVIYKLVNGVDQAPFPGGTVPAFPPLPWKKQDEQLAGDFDPAAFGTAAVTLQIIGGFLGTFLDTGFTFYTDIHVDGAPKPVAVMSGVFTLIGGLLSVPPLIGQDWASPSTGAFLASTGWGIADIAAAAVFGTNAKNLGDTLIGGPVCCITACVTLGFNIWGNVGTGGAAMDYAQAVVGFIPDGVFQPLRTVATVLAGKARVPFLWAFAIGSAIFNVIGGLMDAIVGLCEIGGRPSFMSLNPGPPTGTVNQSYNYTLPYSGGDKDYNQPLNFTCVNNTQPPAGLSLDPNSGLLSGTPTAQGTTKFTVLVYDSFSPPLYAAPQDFSVTINPA